MVENGIRRRVLHNKLVLKEGLMEMGVLDLTRAMILLDVSTIVESQETTAQH